VDSVWIPRRKELKRKEKKRKKKKKEERKREGEEKNAAPVGEPLCPALPPAKI